MLSKVQSVLIQLHFGNEDTDMEQHSAHNNTSKTQKSHYTANTRQTARTLLGNESKRNIKMHSGWLVLPSVMSLGMVGLIPPNRKMLSVGEGGSQTVSTNGISTLSRQI